MVHGGGKADDEVSKCLCSKSNLAIDLGREVRSVLNLVSSSNDNVKIIWVIFKIFFEKII